MAVGALADFSGWYDTPPPPLNSTIVNHYTVAENNIGGLHWSLSGSGVAASGPGGEPYGAVDSGGKNQLFLFGNTSASGGKTLFTVPIVPNPDRPTVTFSWQGSYLDIGDTVGYYLNGTYTSLASATSIVGDDPNPYYNYTPTGFKSVVVAANDVFGYWVNSSPSGGAPSTSVTFRITQFTAPVPEVSTVLANGLVLLGGVSGLFVYRRNKSVRTISA